MVSKEIPLPDHPECLQQVTLFQGEKRINAKENDSEILNSDTNYL
jgi:hypothetical protein